MGGASMAAATAGMAATKPPEKNLPVTRLGQEKDLKNMPVPPGSAEMANKPEHHLPISAMLLTKSRGIAKSANWGSDDQP